MLQEVPPITKTAERLESFNPRTGEKLGEVPVATPADVRAAVERARRAQKGWAAVGVDGLFFEVHEEPARARSAAANALPLGDLRGLLQTVIEIRRIVEGP